MRMILEFRTVQCLVRIFDTEQDMLGERIYAIISNRLKDNRILVRFGTKKQVDSIARTYRLEKKFSL